MAAQKQPKPSKKAEAAEAHEPQQPQPSTPQPKKRGKLVLIASIVVVLAAGGAGGFYFMQSAHSDSGPVAPPPKPAVFVPLETFTVNLLSDPTQMQFLQTGVTLKLSEKAWGELVKDRLPEVRNRVLMVLSAKRGSELLSATGKEKLAAELGDAIRNVIAPAAPVPARVASAEAGTKDAQAAGKEPEQTAKASDPAANTPAKSSESSTHATTKSSAEDPNKPTLEVLFTSFIIQ
jgi:flagellar FliL protein